MKVRRLLSKFKNLKKNKYQISEMGHRAQKECIDLPFVDFTQITYSLNQDIGIALISTRAEGSFHIDVLIKFVNKETKRYMCLDDVLLKKIFKQLHQFDKPNIDYPCIDTRYSEIIVRPMIDENVYRIEYQTKYFVLDAEALKNLTKFEQQIFADIKEFENKQKLHKFFYGEDTVF